MERESSSSTFDPDQTARHVYSVVNGIATEEEQKEKGANTGAEGDSREYYSRGIESGAGQTWSTACE